jgi:hypothetical protein
MPSAPLRLVVVTVLAPIVLLLAAPGCFLALDDDMPGGPAATQFIALQRDFAGYKRWPSVVVGTSPVDGHATSTKRTAFVNVIPDEGAASFPVGTIIVKQGAGAETLGLTGDQVHAIVKRGAGFNADGAVGWEWFELSTDERPTILWRGSHPPNGENYACLPGQPCGEGAGDCNACHEAHVANDYIQSAPLQLSAIQQTFANAKAP